MDQTRLGPRTDTQPRPPPPLPPAADPAAAAAAAPGSARRVEMRPNPLAEDPEEAAVDAAGEAAAAAGEAEAAAAAAAEEKEKQHISKLIEKLCNCFNINKYNDQTQNPKFVYYINFLNEILNELDRLMNSENCEDYFKLFKLFKLLVHLLNNELCNDDNDDTYDLKNILTAKLIDDNNYQISFIYVLDKKYKYDTDYIIENTTENKRIVNYILQPENYGVEAALNGREGTGRAAEGPGIAGLRAAPAAEAVAAETAAAATPEAAGAATGAAEREAAAPPEAAGAATGAATGAEVPPTPRSTSGGANVGSLQEIYNTKGLVADDHSPSGVTNSADLNSALYSPISFSAGSALSQNYGQNIAQPSSDYLSPGSTAVAGGAAKKTKKKKITKK